MLCSVCGGVDIAAQNSHSFTDYKSDNNATCMADGTKTAKCDTVGCTATDTVTDVGSKKQHSFTNYVSDNNATCMADGTKTAECDTVGCTATDTVTDVGSKKQHSFTTKASSSLASAATCTEAAKYYVQCDNCEAVSDTKTVSVGEKNKDNHVGGTEVRYAKDATYTETGYTGDTYCLGCNQKIADGTVIPKKTSSSSSSGSSGASTYTITVIKNPDGSISTNRKTASKGTEITVSVEPNAGHTLKTLLVTDRKGNELDVRKKNDKYLFTMPASAVTVQATFAEKESSFDDVPDNAYYYDAVMWAVDKEITSGINDTSFNPNGICTRAQMVTFLWRSAGKPEPVSKANPFEDVNENAYYYKAVLWAVENGITNGTSKNAFSPDTTCTRGQAVTFLYRYAGLPITNGMTDFVDVPETAFCYHAVIWAASEGITGGTSATTFSPADFCTRAQIVTFLYRYQTK